MTWQDGRSVQPSHSTLQDTQIGRYFTVTNQLPKNKPKNSSICGQHHSATKTPPHSCTFLSTTIRRQRPTVGKSSPHIRRKSRDFKMPVCTYAMVPQQTRNRPTGDNTQPISTHTVQRNKQANDHTSDGTIHRV
jgi:hypothetical protein